MGRPRSKGSSASSTHSAASSSPSIFSTGRFINIEEVDCEVFIKSVPLKPNIVRGFMLFAAGYEPARSHQLMQTKIRTFRGIDSEGRISEWREKEQDWVKKRHTSGKRDGKMPPTQMPRPAQNRFPRPPPPGARQPQPGRQGIPPPPGFPPRPAGGFHQPGVQVVDEDDTSSDGGSDYWSEDSEVVNTSHAQPPPNFIHRQGGPGPVRGFPGPPPPPPPPQGGLPGGVPFIRR